MILAHFIGKKNWQNGRTRPMPLGGFAKRAALQAPPRRWLDWSAAHGVRTLAHPARLLIADADAVMGKMNRLRTARRRQARATL